MAGTLLILFGLTSVLGWYFLQRVPAPLPATAAPSAFSEERAMLLVSHLTDTIGDRQVSTQGAEDAAQYLLSVGQSLAAAAARDRPDLIVEAFLEQVSGSMTLAAFGHSFGNAYANITNVVLRIAPRSGPGARAPGVLINSHYDSALGSVGASDAATCIGVMLEVARAVVADSGTLPAAPLVFLLNGAEETLMQGAHGFMASSPHAAGLGAFINLESTGPWGPDILFQSSGDWTLPTYARVAPYPRGNTVFQDFFDLGLIPADTDYRLFSYRRAGSLPGIDVAQVFDGLAYHTRQDRVERVRPGTLQSMGENTLAATLEFARVLAAGQPPAAETHGDGYVVYSYTVARVMHQLPAAVLGAALIGNMLLPSATPAFLHGFGLVAALGGALRAFLSVLLAHLLPAFFGAARALFTDAPIVWYGRYWLVYCIFLPVSFAGLLLPYVVWPPRQGANALTQALGSATFFAALASLLTSHNIFAGYMAALWSGSTILAVFLARSSDSWRGRAAAALTLALPIIVNMPVGVTALLHVVEKIGLAGSVEGWLGLALGDLAAGGITGVAVYLTLGTTTPHLAAWLGRRGRSVLVALLLLSVAAASWASLAITPTPYTAAAPKRMFVQHLHLHEGGQVTDSVWAVAAIDGFPALKSLGSLPLDGVTAYAPSHWESLYPLGRLVQGVVLPAPGLGPDAELPTLRTLGYAPSPSDPALRRWELEFDTLLPAWGVINVTGPLQAWSYEDKLDPVQTAAGFDAHMTRIATGLGTRSWRWWVEAAPGVNLALQTHVVHLGATPETQAFAAQLPDWVSPAIFTTYQAQWTLNFV